MHVVVMHKNRRKRRAEPNFAAKIVELPLMAAKIVELPLMAASLFPWIAVQEKWIVVQIIIATMS